MQKIKTFLLISLITLVINTHAADEFNETLLNNEASGYVNMLESFINKATEECKSLLGKNDDWRNSLITDWTNDNETYTRAVRLWTNFYISKLSVRSGEGVAQYEEQKIRSVINMRGTNIKNDIIKGSDEEKMVACKEFENKLHNDELNISDQSPHYTQLQKMVELYR